MGSRSFTNSYIGFRSMDPVTGEVEDLGNCGDRYSVMQIIPIPGTEDEFVVARGRTYPEIRMRTEPRQYLQFEHLNSTTGVCTPYPGNSAEDRPVLGNGRAKVDINFDLALCKCLCCTQFCTQTNVHLSMCHQCGLCMFYCKFCNATETISTKNPPKWLKVKVMYMYKWIQQIGSRFKLKI